MQSPSGFLFLIMPIIIFLDSGGQRKKCLIFVKHFYEFERKIERGFYVIDSRTLQDEKLTFLKIAVNIIKDIYAIKISQQRFFGVSMKKLGHLGIYTLLVFRREIEERRVGKECRSRWSPYH